MADDLREMIAALKIVSVVERIGDYAKNIAKRVALMDQTRSIEAIPVLMSMSSLVAELVHDALDSFAARDAELAVRSEEHTSELQSLMRISYAVFCLKKKKNKH